jgi:hypothetical protein
MKKYLFGFTALALAVAFSAFTSAPFVSYKFKPKVGVDMTSESALETETNWETTAISCNSTQQDLACIIEVDQAFTHTEQQGEVTVRVLNTTGANVIAIDAENGLLTGGTQYKRIASGLNYTFTNKVLQ